MALDHATFFAYARRAPFRGKLTQEQVEGTERILSAWHEGHDRHLACILATAFQEAGCKMVAVRKGFTKTDAGARRAVAGGAYAKPVDGHVYYVRGLVQITWEPNYRKMGEALVLDLVGDPDKALDPDFAVDILIGGMTNGETCVGTSRKSRSRTISTTAWMIRSAPVASSTARTRRA